jgi:hypothetical protein
MIVEVFFAIVLLVIASWMLFFGALGALIAQLRTYPLARGLLLGAVLGPIGCALILWRTRRASWEEPLDTTDLADEWSRI